MTRSGENVSAPESPEQGWQRSQLLVAGGDRAHSGWSPAKDAVLSRGVKQFRTGALAENDRRLQRAGEAQQLKLFPSQVEPPADDPQVPRVRLNQVRLERTRQFGACWLGWELWRRLELDRLAVDEQEADVPWSRV